MCRVCFHIHTVVTFVVTVRIRNMDPVLSGHQETWAVSLTEAPSIKCNSCGCMSQTKMGLYSHQKYQPKKWEEKTGGNKYFETPLMIRLSRNDTMWHLKCFIRKVRRLLLKIPVIHPFKTLEVGWEKVQSSSRDPIINASCSGYVFAILKNKDHWV